MTHFGLICPAATGHLNPMTTLGHELKKRGHRVTLFGILDAQSKTLAAGLEFWAIGESEFPRGVMAQLFAQLGKLSGLAALRYTIAWIEKMAAMFLREAPQALKEAGVEALLVDQVSPEGGTIAEFLGIPFVSVCNAMMINRDVSVPPFNTSWSYSSTWWALLRNRVGYELLNYVGRPIREVIDEYRREWKLPPHFSANDSYSQLAQISQQPAELEFPRENLPNSFHFTGPYHHTVTREPVSFPFEKLSGQPLIYASMGTVQNRLLRIFNFFAEACNELNAQLVISLGGSATPESLQELPGNPLVVGYAPQLELLQKATLTITHAGMNTTLESLSNGVPMVAIPITNDQPGVAARLVWAGAGEMIPLNRLNVPRLRAAIQKVLTEDSYKKNAVRLQEAIQKAGGVSRAIDIVEQVVATGKPVLSDAK
ncbi:glycosyl transferase family protein [Nostoc commune NIES-4072]|uniref:Glycosyl transferase family protein n=1 Tax=Nostoc commune NIES-4072 TaxID=2005467 RepID=A0A2R5G2P5_NOSCO|nr:glycosyltransferase [Nostoc commune]BBD66902.1 glycosyl transferase family protein [Nostoc commune HK-02]GBG22114.1 glycosyl transferase family protein [Nostoc commune NIES-4072]